MMIKPGLQKQKFDHSIYPTDQLSLTKKNGTSPRYLPRRNDFRPLFPLKLRVTIFHIFHDAIHQGPEKAFMFLESFYYWHKMRGDIIQQCKYCPKCQTCKISRYNRQILNKFANNSGQLEIIHMNLVGQLLVSRDNRYILNMRDCWSGVLIATPIATMTLQKYQNPFKYIQQPFFWFLAFLNKL